MFQIVQMLNDTNHNFIDKSGKLNCSKIMLGYTILIDCLQFTNGQIDEGTDGWERKILK